MTIEASVFVATSLDGFIAREDGGLDWLEQANATVPAGEDCGFQAFMDSVDMLVMGRNTYEKVLSFGQWAYGNKPVLVLSRNKIMIPKPLLGLVTVSAESPQEICDRLSKQGFKHLYIDGGLTIQRFLAAELIQNITITFIPVVLGKGIPLFNKSEKDTLLKLVRCIAYDCGFAQLGYEVVNPVNP